ncbi:MAG: hypothetical protein KF767_15130 [Bdellovibrionaceae bacterium]|nr:hypothetical protein [Pseudobdellovibrionaceae bacterium]
MRHAVLCLFLCLHAQLLLFGSTSLAQEPPSVINVGVKNAKLPTGLRADRETIVQATGSFEQSCHALHAARIESPSPGQHRLIIEAKITGDNCKPRKKTFNEKIHLGLLPAGAHVLTFTRADGTEKSISFTVKPGRELKVEQPSGDIFAEHPKDSALPTEKYHSPLQIETREVPVPLNVQPSAPVVPPAPPVEDAAVLPFNADDLPSGE